MAELDVSVELRLLDSLSVPARRAFDRLRAGGRRAGAAFGVVNRDAAAAGDAIDELGASARRAGEASADIGRGGSLRRAADDARGAARGMDAVAASGRRAGDALQQAEARAGRLRRALDGVGRGLQGVGRAVGGLQDAGAGAAAAGLAGAAALAAPVRRERGYLQDATVAFNDRDREGILAGVAELRALDQEAVARGGGTLDSARAMRGAYFAGGVAFEEVRRLAPLTQRAATAAGAEGADFANTLMAGAKSGQFSYREAEKVLGMMLTAGASGSFEARDMAQYLPGIFNATGDMRGMKGTAQHLAGLEVIRDAAGDSAEAANRYQNLLSFRNSQEAYKNLKKKGVNLAHVYRDAAKKGEDMNLAFVNAIQGIVERNKAYQRYKKQLAGASGEDAVKIRNEMNVIQKRIFSEIIGDMQAGQAAMALVNGRGRYDEILSGLGDRPEAMIDKMFSVMTSSTQENLNRLANEWEKGMDRVLEVVKGPLSGALEQVTGIMAAHPELTALAGGATAAGAMFYAAKGALGILRMARGESRQTPGGQARAGGDLRQWREAWDGAPEYDAERGRERRSASHAARRRRVRPGAALGEDAGQRGARRRWAPRAENNEEDAGQQENNRRVPSRAKSGGEDAGRQAGRLRPGRGTLAAAGGVLLGAATFGMDALETESRDDLRREQKNEAHAGEVGALAGSIAGAKMGAAALAWAGPVGSAIGAAAGAALGGMLGSDLGKTAYAKTMIEAPVAAATLPYDPDDPTDYLTELSGRAEAAGRTPVRRPDAFDDYGAALFGGKTSFLDTGEGLEERLAALTSRNEDRRDQEEFKAALLEAARNIQAAQDRPIRVELHTALELDGSILATTVEERMIREAARR